jgi:hypothetical protein
VLSSDSLGEHPEANLIDELFADNLTIPGIELLWPDECINFLNDWGDLARRICPLTKGKAYAAYVYLCRHCEELATQKQRLADVDDDAAEVANAQNQMRRA